MATNLDKRGTESVIMVVPEETATRSSRVLWQGTFPATKDQISVARLVVRGALAGHPRFDVDLVAILVSELTTNAVRHSGSHSFMLTIARTTHGDLRVTVTDEGRGSGTPHLRPEDLDDIGGRGLRLVDHEAKRWGMTREYGTGLTVWFDLSPILDGREPPSPQSIAPVDDTPDANSELAAPAPQPRPNAKTVPTTPQRAVR